MLAKDRVGEEQVRSYLLLSSIFPSLVDTATGRMHGTDERLDIGNGHQRAQPTSTIQTLSFFLRHDLLKRIDLVDLEEFDLLCVPPKANASVTERRTLNERKAERQRTKMRSALGPITPPAPEAP